jgi:hypothetical protein
MHGVVPGRRVHLPDDSSVWGDDDSPFATYHRGYIADMPYQVPANQSTTDLTVFIRDVPLNIG